MRILYPSRRIVAIVGVEFFVEAAMMIEGCAVVSFCAVDANVQWKVMCTKIGKVYGYAC